MIDARKTLKFFKILLNFFIDLYNIYKTKID